MNTNFRNVCFVFDILRDENDLNARLVQYAKWNQCIMHVHQPDVYEMIMMMAYCFLQIKYLE